MSGRDYGDTAGEGRSRFHDRASRKHDGEGTVTGTDQGRWRNDLYDTHHDNVVHKGRSNAGGNRGGRDGGYRDTYRGSREDKGTWGRHRRRGYGYSDGDNRDRGDRGTGDDGGGDGGNRNTEGGWRQRSDHQSGHQSAGGEGDNADGNKDGDGNKDQDQDQDGGWGGGGGGGWGGGWGGGEGGGGGGDGGGAKGGGSGSERWRKHAEAMTAARADADTSAVGGGGGHYRARRNDHGHGQGYGHGHGFGHSHGQGYGQSQMPEVQEPKGEREQGRVCSIKDSFGFVRCMDRPGDLFFHLTEAPSDIDVGAEVDFFVGTGGRSGKECALQLNVLPPGTVSARVILDATFLGVIERDARPGPSVLPGTLRSHMLGRSRPQDFNQPEGLIKITGAPAVEAKVETETTETYGQGEREEQEKDEGDGDGEGGTAASERGGEEVCSGVTESASNGMVRAPLGLTGAMVTYVAADVLEKNATYTSNANTNSYTASMNRLRRGDEVRFKVSQEKISGRKHAVEVMLVRTNKERREQEQLKKLMESGASRHQGVVKRLTPDFGFLQSMSCPETVYFSTADISTSTSTTNEHGNGIGNQEGHLRVGAQAEFWVVPDRTKDNKKSLRALDMILLPPDTFTTEEETHKAARGIVQRAPTLLHRQNFGARDGGMQPGAARFSIPYLGDSDETRGEGKGRGERGTDGQANIVASLNHKELGKSQVATLEVGDEIEADLWQSKLGGGKTQAKNVRLVSFGGERVSGLVRTICEGGFGFIRPLEESEDIYFRLADVCRNDDASSSYDQRGHAPEVQEGTEVVFTVKGSDNDNGRDKGKDRGRGREREKKRATRIQILPKGTLELEMTLAKGVCGVVTRDAKGSGQGIITVTDGNSLEVPLDARFPKIARQVAAFAQQDVEKKLAFPSSLTAAERNAVHRLAAEAGLAHEGSSEDPNRIVHVTKPASEEEAVAIREAETKRAHDYLNAARERSKDGDRSQSVTFYREDASKALDEPAARDAAKPGNSSDKVTKESSNNNVDSDTEKADKAEGKLTQDFRTERRGKYSAAAQRGDLVTFDVLLHRGSMKRRGTNIRVTKRASPISSTVGSDMPGLTVSTSRSMYGAKDSGQDEGKEKEYLGVVSLVQVERHYGFIEVLDTDEKVFFHLSDVLPDGLPEAVPEDDGGNKVPADGDGQATPNHPAMSPNSINRGSNNTRPAKAVITRGQEVAFRIGQRQGKGLGLRVRKLPTGTLPRQEILPHSFVGVVVVPPRNVNLNVSNGTPASGNAGTAERDKNGNMNNVNDVNALASVAEMEGILVLLREKKSPGDEDDKQEDSSTREAEKEINKAHRMLSSAGLGLRVAPSAQAASADQDFPLDPSSSLTHLRSTSSGAVVPKAAGIAPPKWRMSRGTGGVLAKGPPPFSVLRFLATDTGTAAGGFKGIKEAKVVETDTSTNVNDTAAGDGDALVGGTPMTGEEGAAVKLMRSQPNGDGDGEGEGDQEEPQDHGGLASFPYVPLARGDLVEFDMVARRGQRLHSQRVGQVSLLTKGGLPCRRAKVIAVDGKAGVAHVELLQPRTGSAADVGDKGAMEEEGKEKEGTIQRRGDASAAAVKDNGEDGGRIFFLLKEMVGAAGPVRNGDEVDLVLPTSRSMPTPIPPSSQSRKSSRVNSPGGMHAVGAVRVQDLKSLSGARSRVNLDLRDSLKGAQVRMAQGPDGAGFRPGHRATPSLYSKLRDESSAAAERETTSAAASVTES